MSREDPVTDLGKDAQGRRWWLARLYWTDALTGKACNTKRKIQAASKAVALTKREELLVELRAGKQKTERKRFREVAAEYLATVLVAATKFRNESEVRTLNGRFGEWFVDAIEARHCQDFLDGLTTGPGNVNNIRATLINVLRHACRKHYIELNVAKATERARKVVAQVEDEEDEDLERAQAERVLTPEQMGRYFDDLEGCEPDVYPLVFTQFLLGCRFSEVSALRRESLNLETGIVWIRRGQYRGFKGKSKGKRARKVALPLEGRAVLRVHLDRMAREQPPGWEELVFPRPVTGRPRSSNFWSWATVMRAIERSFERCKIEVKGKTHVARHTNITIATEVAPSEALVRKVVGHRAKGGAHEGYIHPTDGQVIRLGEAVAGALLGTRRQTVSQTVNRAGRGSRKSTK